uniref:hypothetical protein n=1 Tax=Pseudoruminococcus massiliensis TaxID=2086583 RepID=UPI003FEDE80F
ACKAGALPAELCSHLSGFVIWRSRQRQVLYYHNTLRMSTLFLNFFQKKFQKPEKALFYAVFRNYIFQIFFKTLLKFSNK